MSRSLRRGAVAAVIIATAPILTACAAGENAASLHVEPDSAATSITKGPSSLKLDQIVVVTDATGQAPANIMTSISNNGTKADTLTSVTVDGRCLTEVVTGTQVHALELTPIRIR